jgi:hypothetical protein
MDYKNFFTTDNKSGWKTRESLLKKNEPKIYDELKIFIVKNNLNELPFKQQVWHFINNDTEIKKCLGCGVNVEFRDTLLKGYRNFCSLPCANSSGLLEKRASEAIKIKYGVDSFPQHESFVGKVKQTKLDKYGDENYNNIPKTLKTQGNKIHNNKYDYSLVDYVNSKTKVKIICPIHGVFEQRFSDHLRGQGCSKCGDLNSSNSRKMGLDEFVKRSNIKHNNKYDYSLVEYVNSKTKVKIICPIHGVHEQRPESHLINGGCKLCGILSNSKSRTKSISEFIDNGNQIHNNKYSYEKVNYINATIKVTINCPIHGDFEQIPDNHLTKKYGCSKCSNLGTSRPESNLKDFINSLGIQIEENNRVILNGKELDIYIPSKNIAIEYDGLYWHDDNHVNNNYHLNKTIECEDNSIQLIHVFEDEWRDKQEIVKSRLMNILGLTSNKIYGRKTQIREVTPKDSKTFLNTNHIQGNVNSKIKLGLYYDDELVSLMTFGLLRKSLGSISKEGSYELLRFCNKLDTTVIGGADKLLKYFINTYTPIEIISYADRRWSQGNLYKKLGFDFVHDSSPNYFYVINNKREYRFKYRKDVLVKEGFDPSKSERQIMKESGFNRIYDCGNKKWLLKIK